MAETEFKYDVFISYSSANKDWVRKDLLSVLEKAGLKVCIDFRDFLPGKPAIKNIRDGILESRHTLLVLTEPYLKSGWTDFENMLSQTIDTANRKGRIVPLLKEKCDLPLEISYLTYVNFCDPDDWDIAWKQLFDALGKSDASTLETWRPSRWFFGHRYGDIENFTGRTAELKMLDEWLSNDKDNLLALRALGGFGKSILAWQWFNNNVDKTKWQTAVWWSFYEKESGFESFLAETLRHLGVEVKQSARQQVNDLLEALRGTNILIVLDGFERLLRQYGRMDAALQSDDEDADIDSSQRDCSSPLAETFLRGLSGAGMKSKVLMTTRLCPRVLESADGKLLKGCREEALSAFSPEDAVTYFHNEGIKATRAEIIAACSAYGYHPLSLSLLVGLINEDHEHRGDIAAVKNLEIFEDVRARRHHVLERAYESLAPERRDLLSKISCFRGSMGYEDIKAMFVLSSLKGVRRFWYRFISKLRKYLVLYDRQVEKVLFDLPKHGLLQYNNIKEVHSSLQEAMDFWLEFISKLHKVQIFDVPDLDKALLDLRKRGLLLQSTSPLLAGEGAGVRYDMHPIVRHYAYDHLTADKKRQAHEQLADYFIDAMLVKNKNVKTLEDLAPVIELYHHMVMAGNLDEARRLFRDRIALKVFFQFGAYRLCVELLCVLFPDGEEKLPRLKGESAQAWTLNMLAIAFDANGYSRRAVPLLEMNVAITEKTGYKKNITSGLVNLANAQLKIGALSTAERNLRRQIELCREIADEFVEDIGHLILGRVLSYCGAWQQAEQELDKSLESKDGKRHVQSQSVTWSYRALRFLLMARDNPQSSIVNCQSSIECAQRALELADETARDLRFVYPISDYIQIHWLLGAAYLMNNELTLAEENLSKALNLCRQINAVDAEADILLDIARLRYAQGDFKDAQEKASEALVITERSGYVLQGADVNLFLAELALTPNPSPDGRGESERSEDGVRERKERARKYAETALKLATCDGPPYYYKVAYEEAERLLEKLKDEK